MFYHAEDGDAEDILESMETLDDNMDSEEVEFVKCSDEDAVSYYGLTVIPSLVYFEVMKCFFLSFSLLLTFHPFSVSWFSYLFLTRNFVSFSFNEVKNYLVISTEFRLCITVT